MPKMLGLYVYGHSVVTKWNGKKGLHSAQNCFVKIENSIKKGSICCYFLGVIPRYCRVFSQFYSLHQ